MSFRVRLLLVVATTFAVVVVGCVYAAHVSASRELRAQTDQFLTQRASDPHLLGPGGGQGGGPGGDGDHPDAHEGTPLYNQTLPHGIEPDAITQFIQSNGSATQLVSNQTVLPVDATDRYLAANGGKPRLRNVTIDGQPYRMITAPLSTAARYKSRAASRTRTTCSRRSTCGCCSSRWPERRWRAGSRSSSPAV